MRNILKIILWILVIGIVIYLAFGKTKKEVIAPTPEMTGGAGGERAENGPNIDTSADIYSESSL